MTDKKKEQHKEKNKNNQSLREQAINKSEVDGQDINHQVEDKRDHHLPRDTA
ncbi:hypothetical protein [Allomuricauda sp. d1]|uniref:hypothetical protein n=1 Tax=Allomuricauda sp. d1 TaxID=3136725 RepID=UPI0031D3FCFE